MPHPIKPSRRSLFVGAAATAVAATVTAAPGFAAPSPTMSIAEAWERSRVMFNGPAMSDAEFEAFYVLEQFVIDGPITGSADLVAKLKVAALGYEHGERGDGGDQRALAQAIQWIEAH